VSGPFVILEIIK